MRVITLMHVAMFVTIRRVTLPSSRAQAIVGTKPPRGLIACLSNFASVACTTDNS